MFKACQASSACAAVVAKSACGARMHTRTAISAGATSTRMSIESNSCRSLMYVGAPPNSCSRVLVSCVCVWLLGNHRQTACVQPRVHNREACACLQALVMHACRHVPPALRARVLWPFVRHLRLFLHECICARKKMRESTRAALLKRKKHQRAHMHNVCMHAP